MFASLVLLASVDKDAHQQLTQIDTLTHKPFSMQLPDVNDSI